MFFLLFCLTLSVPKKLKNSIFEIPIIPQTLKINNRESQVETVPASMWLESLLNILQNICG